MISDELNDIISQLKLQGEMDFLSAATEEQINKFETNNSISFHQKHKEWLLFSDGGSCFLPAGIQLYGVAHKPVIDVNDNDRPSEDYIVIGALSTGDPILCNKTGEQISIYNHEAGKIESDETYPDFFAFLLSLHDEILGIGG